MSMITPPVGVRPSVRTQAPLEKSVSLQFGATVATADVANTQAVTEKPVAFPLKKWLSEPAQFETALLRVKKEQAEGTWSAPTKAFRPRLKTGWQILTTALSFNWSALEKAYPNLKTPSTRQLSQALLQDHYKAWVDNRTYKICSSQFGKLAQSGEFDAALATFQKALKLDPTNMRVYLDLGNFCKDILGELQGARPAENMGRRPLRLSEGVKQQLRTSTIPFESIGVEAFQRAIKIGIFPGRQKYDGREQAWQALSEMYAGSGQYEKAIEAQKQSIEVSVHGKKGQSYSSNLQVLGNLYLAAGQLDKIRPLIIERLEGHSDVRQAAKDLEKLANLQANADATVTDKPAFVMNVMTSVFEAIPKPKAAQEYSNPYFVHANYARSQQAFASFFQKNGRPEQAKAIYEDILAQKLSVSLWDTNEVKKKIKALDTPVEKPVSSSSSSKEVSA